MRCYLLILALAMGLDVVAEEVALETGAEDGFAPPTPIYESVDGIAIGRVFVSPGERQRLDAVRHLPQDTIAEGNGEAAPSAEAEPVRPVGVGFIQVSGKAPRVFRDGDFVRAPRGDVMVNQMPAGLIVRHEGEEQEAPTKADPEGSDEP